MATPATWMAIAAVAGAGLSAYSQIEQSKAQEKMSQYNAAVARQDAEAAREAAAYEELRHKDETGRLRGRMLALYGKSGVTMEGSPLEVMAESAAQAELDTLAIRRAGATAASRHEAQAQLDVIRGRSARRAGYYGAGTTLLSSAGQIGMAYGRPKRKTG